MSIIFRILIFLAGASAVTFALMSVIKTFVLPRSAPDSITRLVFLAVRRLFTARMHWAKTYAQRDQIMAYYAPIGLLALIPAWVSFVLIGYMAMFWATGPSAWDLATWYSDFRLSGSSLFTLGFAQMDGLGRTLLGFSEAAIGLLLVALFIAYLPTMYAAFSRREAAVSLLEVRAGSPPAATTMLLRFHRNQGLDRLREQWQAWEIWFADIEESHTSLPALVFFRSPQPDHSWVTAAGAVLDTAAITLSTVDVPYEAEAALCIRAGFLALRHIADFFSVPYDPNPKSTDFISIQREEFDTVVRQLAEGGLPIKPDQERAWRDFSGWRVNYDTVLLALASLTMAPYAPWSSDRATKFRVAPLFTKWKI
jgi:hypothetical protein